MKSVVTFDEIMVRKAAPLSRLKKFDGRGEGVAVYVAVKAPNDLKKVNEIMAARLQK